MLRVLRGDAVDWKEVEERHTPQRRCVGCSCRCFKDEFLLSQWNRKDEMHRCNACLDKQREAGTPFECTTCFQWKAAAAFDEQNMRRYAHRVCVDCIEKRVCIACGTAKVQDDFTASEWLHTMKHRSGRQQGRCKECMARNKPQAALRRCRGDCQQLKPEADFTPTEWLEAAKQRTGRQQGACKTCMSRNKAQKICSACKEAKCESEYKSKKEFMRSDADRRCKACSGIRRGLWTSIKCNEAQAPDAFSLWLEKRKVKRNNGTARCNACKREEEAEERNVAEGSRAEVQDMR